MAKMGRPKGPAKYTPELLERAWEYLESWENTGESVPQIAGLARHLGIHRDTVYAWRGDEGKEQFDFIVEQVLAAQEQCLVNLGLAKVFDASVTKMMLSKHGYADKSESAITGAGGGALNVIMEGIPSSGCSRNG